MDTSTAAPDLTPQLAGQIVMQLLQANAASGAADLASQSGNC